MRPTADLATFVTVADVGGFSEAARRLGVSQPAVSRRVAALERRLGTQLVARLGGRFRLTSAGARLHERARSLLAELRRVESDVAASATSLAGTLRVTAPPALARAALVPRLGALHARHPEIRVVLDCSERFVDLAEGTFDIALRLFTPGRWAELVARRLASFPVAACAAPAYLERRGLPRRPADLAAHDCLVHLATREHAVWTFSSPGSAAVEKVRVAGPLATNDMEALRLATVAGLGVALLPSFLAASDLREGRLRRIIARWRTRDVPLYVVHAGRRGAGPRVRAFLDFLDEALSPAGRR